MGLDFSFLTSSIRLSCQGVSWWDIARQFAGKGVTLHSSCSFRVHLHLHDLAGNWRHPVPCIFKQQHNWNQAFQHEIFFLPNFLNHLNQFMALRLLYLFTKLVVPRIFFKAQLFLFLSVSLCLFPFPESFQVSTSSRFHLLSTFFSPNSRLPSLMNFPSMY